MYLFLKALTLPLINPTYCLLVEGNHYIKLGSWCTTGSTTCVGNSDWVKPYRCLEGPFQSDALLGWYTNFKTK